jgi:uncharacterized protein YecT (DUF1311 family)
MRLFVLTLALCGGPVAAQEVDCTAAVAQVEMTFCAEQDWLAADAALNVAYAAAMAAMREIDADLPAERRGAETSLRAAQRAWITVRDFHCAAEGFRMHGGSAEPMVIYGCRARLTHERTADLALLAATN